MKAINTMPRSSQKGSAMILSLVVLALMTVTAAFNMQRTTLQVRMVNNLQHKLQINSAAYTYTMGMIHQLSQDNTSTTNLQPLITEAKAKAVAHDDSALEKSLDIYKAYNWDHPSLTHMPTVAGVTNKVTIDDTIYDKPHSLKFVEGNSVGGKAPFFFKSKFISANEPGTITTTMEQGFIILR